MANSRSLVATSGVSMKIYKYSLLFPPLFLAGPAYLSGLPFQEMPMIFDCVYKHSGSQKAYWDPSVVMWQNTTGLSGHLPWGWETSKKSKQILAGLLSAAKAQLLGILSSNTKAYYYCVQIPPLPCLVPGVVALRLSRVPQGSLVPFSSGRQTGLLTMTLIFYPEMCWNLHCWWNLFCFLLVIPLLPLGSIE